MGVKGFGWDYVLPTLVAFGFGMSCAYAQDQTNATPLDVPSTNAAPTNTTSFGSATSLPPVEQAGQAPRAGNSNANEPLNQQMPQFQTSVEQATNAGLVPTVSGGGEATSLVAGGFVPTYPGLTSYGAQAASAASAAASSQKFLTAYAAQSIAYIDNPGQLVEGRVTAISSSSPLNTSLNQPDFYEITSGGLLLVKQLGLQSFFASANFGVTRYFHDSNFDSTRYSFSIGDDYAIGDVCSGAVVANQSESAVPLELSVGSLSLQNTMNSSIEVSSKCRVTGHLYTTSDVRLNELSFTDPLAAENDSMQLFGSGGLEYAVPGFVTMGVLSSITETSFINRGGLGLGLADQTSQISFDGFVSKPISRKLNVSLSAGIVDLATGGPTLSGSIQPIYSANVTYTYSPKTSLNFNYARTIGSPESVVANFEEVETMSLGIGYRFSPKLSFAATAGRSSTSASVGATIPTATTTNPLLSTTSTTGQLSARYALARGASAVLSYQHINRAEGYLGEANANVISLSLNYRR